MPKNVYRFFKHKHRAKSDVKKKEKKNKINILCIQLRDDKMIDDIVFNKKKIYLIH